MKTTARLRPCMEENLEVLVERDGVVVYGGGRVVVWCCVVV